MRYYALAADYDGTIAQDGIVTQQTVAALEKLRATGRKLILVTGRELDELLSIFPAANLFERIVAENGALIYEPATRAVRLLAEAPSNVFVDALRRRNVSPMSVGRVIVATWKPHESAVLETIRDLALDLQVIFNKDAVMVLPAGVNKASGLTAALKELELSPHEVVGVGDAENDHAFLAMSECAVAVQNALLSVKERADLVTAADHGMGVEQLIEQLLANDLQALEGRLSRHALLLGKDGNGSNISLPPYGGNVLIAGPSGSGKSTISKSFLERLQEHRYQFCIIDPEGDYDGLDGAVTIGTSKRGPTLEEILPLLKSADANVVINLIGLPLADRPPFFMGLLPRLQAMRGQCGRPHWIIVDEAHHLLPTAWQPALSALPQQPDRMVFITVHPEQITTAALNAATTVVAVGPEPEKTIANFCDAVQQKAPSVTPSAPFSGEEAGQIVLWRRGARSAPIGVRVTLPAKEHQRHVRKYVEGELAPERSFYFRGPDGKLNLRVQNLLLFDQIGAGVDDATWLYHLQRGDYSRWFRENLHDEKLASEAAEIEQTPSPSAPDTRAAIKLLIERHYTLPVSAPLPMPGTTSESPK
jgi:hydroxymethylpyrimidine pyrophosphatase-like HAD family hydrolase/energy-coupling factor transporter ATP-binding protein EcfA2